MTAEAQPTAGSALPLMLLAAGLLLPVGEAGWWFTHGWGFLWLAPALAAAAWLHGAAPRGLGAGLLLGLAAIVASLAPLRLADPQLALGLAAPGLWVVLAGLGALAWAALDALAATPRSTSGRRGRVADGCIGVCFGLGLLTVWEVLANGFAIPYVLLPPPSAIGAGIVARASVLWLDFQQTFIRAVLPGYAMGCGAGFLVALLVDRVPFLQRGLLPLGNLVSALPIVGIAPIMVMWFGFDWQSKAAVVVVMTFFPMLVNTVTGLGAAGAMERDLLRTYAAGRLATLVALRLPMALPFVFNALKINSTLALIGAIVAEFFGTPIRGMGFRISTEVARLNLDMVWATIAVAAIAGSLFYGALALLERRLTFWHPSYRQ